MIFVLHLSIPVGINPMETNEALELARTSVNFFSIYDMLQMLEVDNLYNTATCYLRRPVQFITSALHADGS
jgi:hypothetical protein